jgi:phosphoribosylformylglycinamidine synthase subunit PurS
MRARVLVRPKAGILDPQGQAVERALPALGFTGVTNVHVGRLIELDVDDPARLPEMCDRLLANPLVEEYEIVESVGADSTGSSAPASPPASEPSTELPRAEGPELPGAGGPDREDSIASMELPWRGAQ